MEEFRGKCRVLESFIRRERREAKVKMKASNQVMEGRDWIFSCWQFFKHWPDIICSSAGKESTCNASNHSSIPGSGRSPGEGTGYPLQYSWAFLVAQTVKNPPAMWETWARSHGWEDPLEEGIATHSSILAWRIPMDRKAGRLQSTGSQRVRHITEQLSTNWHHLSSALAKLNWKAQSEWKLKQDRSRCRDALGGKSLRKHLHDPKIVNVKADGAKARINFKVKVTGVGNQLDMAGKGEGVKDVLFSWARESPWLWTISAANSL